MTTTQEERSPAAPPTQPVEVRPPPVLQPREGVAGMALNALPMLGSVGSIVLVASMSGASGTTRFIAAGMFGCATLGFVLVQVDRQRRQRAHQVGGARRSYLRHLAGVRRAAREAADHRRRTQRQRHPEPSALAALAAQGSRVWERRPHEDDFLHLRHGTGERPAVPALVGPEVDDAEDLDPAALAALRRLLEVHRTQPDLPVTTDLGSRPEIELDGPDPRGRARAVVGQAVTFHGPDHLRVAVLTDPAGIAAWDWVKWLPHAQSPRRRDRTGPARAVATSWAELVALVPEEVNGRPPVDREPALPHLLVVVDPVDSVTAELVAQCPLRGSRGVTLLLVGAKTDHTLDGARPDRLSVTGAEALGRRLAPRASADAGAGGGEDHLALLGLRDVGGAGRRTTPRPPRERLRVAVGTDERGDPVHLDLKEPAEHGMGPHGLVVGATGSGKSEFLRTLVLGLALTHTPDELNLVLVDFKGGATFAGMADLPHTSAVITNLAAELTLVDRMQDALAGELVRRQELLREAGNLASVRDHEQARAAGADLAPLPSLFIVVDEFSELLAAKPEFLDLFVAIGRLGRSLGLHLLLASQRLEEGRLRGLESHLSYRVGLRTFSAAESRTAIGVPDAHTLPAVPGAGYLKPNPATLTRFQSGYVSGPRCRPDPALGADDGRVLPFTVAPGPAVEEPESPASTEGPSLLEEAIAALRDDVRRAHRVWLPPLAEPATLDALGAGDHGPLTVPVGVVDRPRAQRRDALTVDLSGAGGHLAVVGAARSGTSTLLQTLMAGLALANAPQQARFLVLDLGGGSFERWRDLPHVSAVAQRHQPDVVRRAVAEVSRIVTDRETGREESDGEVFVVVDGWGELRTEYDAEATALQQLAGRALGVGVHLLLGSTRWADFRMGLRDQLGTRLEMRLGDPMDSETDRRLASDVPTERPGRGLTSDREHFLAALPRIDGRTDAASLDAGVAGLVTTVTAHSAGRRAPALRLLPEHVDAAEVAADDGHLVLGVEESALAPVALDVAATPHLLVLGEGGAGKTATLRTLVRQVARHHTAQQAQVVLVDHRRSLLGEVPEEHLLHHLTSVRQSEPALRELADYLTSRLPGPDVTPQQLRDRSWWTGAEVFVVVDDYDLAATGGLSPLAPLVPLLAQAGDVGLRLMVARRSGGAARAMHDPVLQSLRDLAMPGLLLSGSPEEGPLLGGVRPGPAVPGRARLITREEGIRTVQVAWTDPAG